MEVDAGLNNARCLHNDLEWLKGILDVRLKLFFEEDCEYTTIFEIPPPDLSEENAVYANIVNHYQMNFAERLVLLLALAPHVHPEILDRFFIVDNSIGGRGFTQFGGLKSEAHSGFIATAQTALFILAGNDLGNRFLHLSIFEESHFFHQHRILTLNRVNSREPHLSASLSISREYLNLFTSGTEYKPDFSEDFPAKRIITDRVWEDLILEDQVMDRVKEIRNWIAYKDMLLYEWGLDRIIKPGYRALFYGPPGTGKTFTASLLGKTMGLDTYRIDLSMMISKFIGETEKNIAKVFDQAEYRNWILFFDEADALFGKRTQTNSSNDRFANQEVSYLLQRVEDFSGVVILSSNLEGNIDDAFARRFQSMIYFPMPGKAERLEIWQSAFSDPDFLDPTIDLNAIAEQYELSGGSIMNVVRSSYLSAAALETPLITQKDIMKGIREEYRKEGKTLR